MMKFLRSLDRHLEKHGNAENHHWTKDESIVALRYTPVRLPFLGLLSSGPHEGFVLRNQPYDS